MKLYEILVPTKFGDNDKPVRTKHHKKWDAYVRNFSGGLTLLTPVKGQWVFGHDVFEERVIPVRILCDEQAIERITQFTLAHYRQIAVMYYVISNECHTVWRKAAK